MATKAKTKAGRVAERKTSRSQSPNRKKETQAVSPSAIDLLEQDHRQVEEWFDEYDELKKDNDRKAELAQNKLSRATHWGNSRLARRGSKDFRTLVSPRHPRGLFPVRAPPL